MKTVSASQRGVLFVGLCCFCVSGVAAPITLTPYNVEPQPASYSISPRALPGQLVYAYDTAEVKGPGIPWPWHNVLVRRDFTPNSASFKGFEVHREREDFVFGPQWLDAERVLFKVGDPDGSFGTYDLVLWNTRTESVETLERNLSREQVWPSPDGRYIAFIRGGNPVPFGDSTPAVLHTIDLTTKEEKSWSGLPSTEGDFWTPDNKLVLTKVSPAIPTKEGEPAKLQNLSLYEVNVGTGAERPLINDAFAPTVSPDGRWLTYLTFSASGEKKENTIPDPTLPAPSSHLNLMLSSRDGKTVENLGLMDSQNAKILWKNDNLSFVVCQYRIAGSNQKRYSVDVLFQEGRVGSVVLHRVSTFRYLVPPGMESSQDDLLLRPLRFSKDDRFLLFELRQVDGDEPQGLSLQALDVSIGKTVMWAHIGSVRGLDWRE